MVKAFGLGLHSVRSDFGSIGLAFGAATDGGGLTGSGKASGANDWVTGSLGNCYSWEVIIIPSKYKIKDLSNQNILQYIANKISKYI